MEYRRPPAGLCRGSSHVTGTSKGGMAAVGRGQGLDPPMAQRRKGASASVRLAGGATVSLATHRAGSKRPEHGRHPRQRGDSADSQLQRRASRGSLLDDQRRPRGRREGAFSPARAPTPGGTGRLRQDARHANRGRLVRPDDEHRSDQRQGQATLPLADGVLGIRHGPPLDLEHRARLSFLQPEHEPLVSAGQGDRRLRDPGSPLGPALGGARFEPSGSLA